MKKSIGKKILRAMHEVKISIGTRLRKWYLGLAWCFDGKVWIEGPIYVRSFGGDVRIGRRVRLGPYVSISCAKGAKLTVGDGVSINYGTFIGAIENIEIGRNVLIGEYCSIRDNDHGWGDTAIPIREQGYSSAAVEIEEDVWLGRGSVICKGVRIHRGAVIGANAVVTKDVPAMAVVAGVPARVIKWRDGAPTGTDTASRCDTKNRLG